MIDLKQVVEGTRLYFIVIQNYRTETELSWFVLALRCIERESKQWQTEKKMTLRGTQITHLLLSEQMS